MFKTPGVSVKTQSSIPRLAKVKLVAIYNTILIPLPFLFSLTFVFIFFSTTFKFVLLITFKNTFFLVRTKLSNSFTEV